MPRKSDYLVPLKRAALVVILASSMVQWSHAQQSTATKKAVVQDAQERLQILGYDPGQADGVMGPSTIAALKKFQKQVKENGSNDLSVTGILDQKTLEALGAEPDAIAEKLHHAAGAGGGHAKPTATGKASKPDGKTQFPDVIHGRLYVAVAMTVNGPDPKVFIDSGGNGQYEVVLTEKTILPPSWGSGDQFHVIQGSYSVYGTISKLPDPPLREGEGEESRRRGATIITAGEIKDY